MWSFARQVFSDISLAIPSAIFIADSIQSPRDSYGELFATTLFPYASSRVLGMAGSASSGFYTTKDALHEMCSDIAAMATTSALTLIYKLTLDLKDISDDTPPVLLTNTTQHNFPTETVITAGVAVFITSGISYAIHKFGYHFEAPEATRFVDQPPELPPMTYTRALGNITCDMLLGTPTCIGVSYMVRDFIDNMHTPGLDRDGHSSEFGFIVAMTMYPILTYGGARILTANFAYLRNGLDRVVYSGHDSFCNLGLLSVTGYGATACVLTVPYGIMKLSDNTFTYQHIDPRIEPLAMTFGSVLISSSIAQLARKLGCFSRTATPVPRAALDAPAAQHDEEQPREPSQADGARMALLR